MQNYPVRNLTPFRPEDKSQAASCARCKNLDEQLAYLGQWIKETENPKLRKQLEKTVEAHKATAVLHRFEQHSSLQMAHPVRSGLGPGYARPRISSFGREKALQLAKRER
jgi:hypothetical protein